MNPDFPNPGLGPTAQDDPGFAEMGASGLFLVLPGSDGAGSIPAKEGSGEECEK